MSRRPGPQLCKILILHAAWLAASGYPERQAASCKRQGPCYKDQAASCKRQAASLTRQNYKIIISYKLKEKEIC